MYTFQYDDAAPMSLDAKVYIAADFYNVPPLKAEVASKLRSAVSEFLPLTLDFIHAIKIIFENTLPVDSDLRDYLAQRVADNYTTLSTNATTGPAFEKLMQEIDVSYQVARCLAVMWNGWKKVQCQACRPIWADQRATIGMAMCPGCQHTVFNWDKYQVSC